MRGLRRKKGRAALAPLVGRRKEAVSAVQVRPQPQPFAGIQRNALRRQQLAARQGRELGMLRGESVGHRLVLVRQDAAGRVDKAAARLQQARRGAQDARLLGGEFADGANAKLTYLSSRTYGGYATTTLDRKSVV